MKPNISVETRATAIIIALMQKQEAPTSDAFMSWTYLSQKWLSHGLRNTEADEHSIMVHFGAGNTSFEELITLTANVRFHPQFTT